MAKAKRRKKKILSFDKWLESYSRHRKPRGTRHRGAKAKTPLPKADPKRFVRPTTDLLYRPPKKVSAQVRRKKSRKSKRPTRDFI